MSKEEFENLLDEHIDDVIKWNGFLTDCTVPLKDYKTRIDRFRFLLVENWCLCKWCQLFNSQHKKYKHWIDELTACIKHIKHLDIDENTKKRQILIQMLVKDYDYNSIDMIERIIRSRFREENLKEKMQICSNFTKNINNIINAISNDSIDTDIYIKETFNIG